MIDPPVTGITLWMYRFPQKLWVVLLGVVPLVACGESASDSSHRSPDPAPTDGAAMNSGAGSSSAPSSAGSGNPGAGGTASNDGGTANPSGGVAPVAGTANADAGSATAGTGAGGAPNPSNEFWMAPDGSDDNPGTEQAPFRTLAFSITHAKPGVTFWVKPGSYAQPAPVSIVFKYSGTAQQPVTLKAAPGARPLFDFSGQTVGNDEHRGIALAANFWRIQGIEIKKTGDNCIWIAGSDNVIEDVIVHECGDTGIQITAPSDQATDDSRAANNKVINCDSWGNLDSATGGENADGFAAKLRIGPGNLFQGCRAWNNADDGWDLFAADDVVTIKECWAFSNGKPLGGSNPQGDGNGFKLGGAPNGAGQGGAVHLVSDSFAFENKSCGFVRNNNPDNPKLTACGAKDNKNAYCDLSVSGEKSMSMSASTARTIARDGDGSLPPMQ